MREKKGLGKLFQKIGIIFKSIFSNSNKVWGKLSPEIQQSFIQGSDILRIVNENDSLSGDEILNEIQKEHPGIDLDKLKEGLLSVLSTLNVQKGLGEETLIILLEILANYLKSKEKEVWAAVSSLASKLIAYALSGGTLVSWATFELLMEFVYHNFIKDK